MKRAINKNKITTWSLVLLLGVPGISPLYAYLDPSSGSLLLLAIFGSITTLFYAIKTLFFRIRNLILGRGGETLEENEALVIYSEGKNYWYFWQPLLNELERRQITLSFWTSDENDPALKEDYQFVKTRFIGAGNRGYLKMNQLKADLCVMTTPQLDVFQIKKSKHVKEYVHILHSTSDPLAYNLFAFDAFDTIFTVGNYQHKHFRQLEALRGTEEKQLEDIGLLFFDTMKQRREALPVESVQEQKCILIAPTWGAKGLLAQHGSRVIEPLVEQGYRVILRPHPQSFIVEPELIDSVCEPFLQNKLFELDRAPDNFESLSRADLLISEFSGIIFDFAFIFEKPVLAVKIDLDHRPLDSFDLPQASWWEFDTIAKIGALIDVEELAEIETLANKVMNDATVRESIKEIKASELAHFGHSAIAVADKLQARLA